MASADEKALRDECEAEEKHACSDDADNKKVR